MSSVFFYISGHGFGHVSREIEVVNALAAACPGLSIVVRTAAARRLFDRTVRPPFTFIEGACDTGVVQIDSLRLDEEETIRRAAEFHRQLPRLAVQEAALLREHEARFVVADAAPLAPVAASAAGVPSVVLANFTWDWIYEGYPEALTAAPDLIATIRDAYRHAGDAWRLPLHGGFTMFDRPIDVPFIARHATRDPLDVRRLLQLPADGPLALSSFGGYGLRDFDLRRLDCLDEWGIVITGNEPPGALPAGVQFVDEGRMYGSGVSYEDLIAVGGRRRHEAGVRHRDRMPGERHRDALHVARTLPRIRGDGRGDAAVPAVCAHRARVAPRRPLARGAHAGAGAAAAARAAADRWRRGRRRDDSGTGGAVTIVGLWSSVFVAQPFRAAAPPGRAEALRYLPRSATTRSGAFRSVWIRGLT